MFYHPFVTVTRRVSLVEQEMSTPPEHPSSPPAISGVYVASILSVLCSVCVDLFILTIALRLLIGIF